MKELNAMGIRIRFLATGDETGGAYALLEFTFPPGFPGPRRAIGRSRSFRWETSSYWT